jgi:isopenicillin-N epimerase
MSPEIRSAFMVDPDLVFLNHGSFGAVPRSVRDAQAAWMERLERDPIEWIGRRIHEELANVRDRVGAFVGCDASELGLVTNATEGVNAALAAIPLQPGDELLCTDHVYNAVLQAMHHRAASCGARVVVVPVPLPTPGMDAMRRAILAGVSDRTRVLVLDHVTSPTAVRMPLGEIATCLPSGVVLLGDGAHAPGAMPLHVRSMGVPLYAANLHKWVMAPRGSAFLRVDPAWQGRVHPCVISHFLGQGFVKQFEWQGTRDFSAWLSVPAAIDFVESIGLTRLVEHNHALASWAHRSLVEGLGLEPLTPLDGSCLTCIASVELPRSLHRHGTVEALQASLRDEDRIEVPVMLWNDRWLLRVSAAVHNLPEHYERLLAALRRRLA